MALSMKMDSDEEESFVIIGKQVEQLEEDEARKKPVSVHDLPFKDSKGRQRFHGAFTGGFSAGYFNSVGTKEGWAPSTFVSSRSSRNDQVSQKAEDFMDEDDFGEHGIAPRKIATAETYTSEERQRKRKALASAVTGDAIGQKDTTLMDLVVPDSLPIGIRLLRKMGWKEGQGVGPRISSKNRKKKKSSNEGKVYGCMMPDVPNSSTEDEGSDEEYLKNVTFAPKDSNPISFDAKDNVHGIGYRGLNPSAALPSAHINLFEPPPVRSSKGKRGIRGKGFGVGALEEDDDDIYGVDHLSNYDMSMDIEDDNHLSGWTAPKGLSKDSGSTPVGYVGKLLAGFTLSTKTLKSNKVYPPPVLPQHFKPVHRFKGPVIEESVSRLTANLTKPELKKSPLTAVDRALALGEAPVLVGSVFDLVSEEDKDKMKKAKSGTLSIEESENSSPVFLKPIENSPALMSTNKTKSSRWDLTVRKTNEIELENTKERVDEHKNNVAFSPSTSFQATPSHQSSLSVTSVESTPPTVPTKPLFAGNLTAYKPFAKTPDKQERYEKYLSLVNQGKKDAYLEITSGQMTEWEREREKDEFIRASKLYKPLSNMMASRFTTARFDDETETVDIPKEGNDKSDKDKAAEMKMFGQLTRDNIEWHPDKVLCKRFNVPDPYPGSSITGLPTIKRDKYSVYNFLSFPSQEFVSQDTINTPPLAIEPKKDEENVSETKDDKKETSRVSFNIKKKVSIFNVLFEDNASVSGQKTTDNQVKTVDIKNITTENKRSESTLTETKDNVAGEKETTKAPSLDLYRAIFNSSDSDESSSSNDEEEEKIQPEKTVEQQKLNFALNETKPPDISPATLKPSVPIPSTSGSRLPGDDSIIQTIEERLSPSISSHHDASMVSSSTNVSKHSVSSSDSDEEMFGPALPKPSSSHENRLQQALDDHGKSYKPKHKYKSKRKEKYEEKHRNRHKEKSREKLKSKHKIKDKKSKHKKNKNKKSKKHKKKKSKHMESESSDDSDCIIVSEDEKNVKSIDQEILSRLRDVPGKRLTAADFM
ncbi:G patch domain-containing protein 1 [Patella vulgata]|uniref:G patch domain-containing protein 1 n=1 Tax=Patella vulgata TaxID=6465 RepID=UPI00217F2E6A|nr:G patch domain-containing protein 1 [Patella vulgata]